MGAGHAHDLYVRRESPVHALPPHCKILATVGFVLAVAVTPRHVIWAFALYAVLLGAVAAIARIPAGTIARRMVIEVPFVAFALFLPFVARGPEVEVLGLALSRDGLWGAFGILAKGTLGVVASILLAATTEPRTLLLGVERLGLPPLLTQIATFMFRYLDVVTDELRRMRVARASRGFEARDLRDARILARSLGSLFLRCYERGERVHLAMLSRGYDGRMPVLAEAGASRGQWAVSAVLPAAAALVAAGAWMAVWTLH
ncbi:cobalt/nickel transport system permease protein [Actinocorallia herbida]|uniref:Cobalt/nickel transport system permease protein n=1 Tax=Actinocorallia herbida TaxID=58109 RepID=A0A3N1D7L6_9ACTN|nr:cobalt ECF transporter T component CbiQ [Actinocorallia herbida]ROO89505.1 cobalt/nickel transport system permease protein [Actinocorallia herbida]